MTGILKAMSLVWAYPTVDAIQAPAMTLLLRINFINKIKFPLRRFFALAIYHCATNTICLKTFTKFQNPSIWKLKIFENFMLQVSISFLFLIFHDIRMEALDFLWMWYTIMETCTCI